MPSLSIDPSNAPLAPSRAQTIIVKVVYLGYTCLSPLPELDVRTPSSSGSDVGGSLKARRAWKNSHRQAQKGETPGRQKRRLAHHCCRIPLPSLSQLKFASHLNLVFLDPAALPPFVWLKCFFFIYAAGFMFLMVFVVVHFVVFSSVVLPFRVYFLCQPKNEYVLFCHSFYSFFPDK